MLFSVGMYLPLETTFAIFVGGIFRWMTDKLRDKGTFNDAQKARIENAGVLTASGLIAGEALCGLVVAGFRAAEKSKGHAILPDATWCGNGLARRPGAGWPCGAHDSPPAGQCRPSRRAGATHRHHVDASFSKGRNHELLSGTQERIPGRLKGLPPHPHHQHAVRRTSPTSAAPPTSL